MAGPLFPTPGPVLVAGLGVTGRAVAEVLTHLGFSFATADQNARAGADYSDLPALVSSPEFTKFSGIITSPGLAPGSILLSAAAAIDLPVISEVELAWQLRRESAAGVPAPWLALTGTNGKTSTVGMLTSILRTAGHQVAEVGNVGEPIVQAVLDPSNEVLAVELSSFQLHYTSSMSAFSSAILNISPDHLDWHGDFTQYAAAKAKIYHQTQVAALFNVNDPRTQDLLEEADVVEGARAVGITTGIPSAGNFGVIEDLLVDRSFHLPLTDRNRTQSGAELATLADLAHLATPSGLPPHLVFNALAAAALARSYQVTPAQVRDGLRAFQPERHRIELVPTSDGISWINDSKATNTHAAQASLNSAAAGTVVWIAGGVTKGAEFDDLVSSVRQKLRAVVVIGVDADALTGALSRHAPDIPVFRVDPGETEQVMTQAVTFAKRSAQPGDTVLLAPACASQDQFRSYVHRGEVFVSAVASEVG